MADFSSAFRGSRKVKKEASSSGTSSFFSNSAVNEINGGRISHLPGLRAQKFLINNSSDKSSFNKEKDIAVYDNYEIAFGTYLLRKLQNRMLDKSNREKTDGLKKSLVSLKFELEESLKKHVKLRKISALGETWMRIIKECNKRIELSKIVKVFESNHLDDLLESTSKVLDRSINMLPLIGVSKSDVESVFNDKMIGEGSQLVECLKNIQHYSNRNKGIIFNIATEINKLEKLLNENSVLRERYNNALGGFTSKAVETNYENLTGIVRKGIQRRFENDNVSTNTKELFEFDELVSAIGKPLSPEAIFSLELPEEYKIPEVKPVGSSTPYSESR